MGWRKEADRREKQDYELLNHPLLSVRLQRHLKKITDLKFKSHNLTSLNELDKNNPLDITITLCPFYTQSSLEDSSLMNPPGPFDIKESRIVKKWDSARTVLECIQRAIYPREIHVVFTFADLGVLKGSRDEANEAILNFHYQVWQKTAREELVFPKISWRFQRYTSLCLFEQFIDTRENTLPGDQFLRLMKVAHIYGNPEKLKSTGQKIIHQLLDQFGFNIASGLLRQYALFDAITTKPDALNLFFERECAVTLLQITDLFDHGKFPRIDITC